MWNDKIFWVIGFDWHNFHQRQDESSDFAWIFVEIFEAMRNKLVCNATW